MMTTINAETSGQDALTEATLREEYRTELDTAAHVAKNNDVLRRRDLMEIKQKAMTEDKEKIMNRKLIINLVDDCTSQNLDQTEKTWNELLVLFKAPHGNGKLSLSDYLVADDKTRKAEKDGLAWIPCSVKDQLGRRVQENMDLASLMVLDIDDGLSLENIHSVLSKYEYALHSSYSHSPSKPKWRVVLPLAEPICLLYTSDAADE